MLVKRANVSQQQSTATRQIKKHRQRNQAEVKTGEKTEAI